MVVSCASISPSHDFLRCPLSSAGCMVGSVGCMFVARWVGEGDGARVWDVCWVAPGGVYEGRRGAGQDGVGREERALVIELHLRRFTSYSSHPSMAFFLPGCGWRSHLHCTALRWLRCCMSFVAGILNARFGAGTISTLVCLSNQGLFQIRRTYVSYACNEVCTNIPASHGEDG